MSDGFYRAFEDLHRGSRDVIKDRLKIYLPFLGPWQEVKDKGIGLDLGCGRGEWLELLLERNFDVIGVDLDAGMLEEACARGLMARQQDALSALKEQESSSCFLVSAFHVVEHIAFDDLKALVQEAYRVLKPGGLLILETPNPENLVVASNNFYIDPTHVRPIPLDLLHFVVSYFGFERVKKLGVNGGASSTGPVSLMDVLAGVAPDGAVVAQKQADEQFFGQFDRSFRVPRGKTLAELAEKYDSSQRAALLEIVEQASALHANLQAEIAYVFSSRSWRWTKPFRQACGIAKETEGALVRFRQRLTLKKIIKRLLRRPVAYVRARPNVERKIVGLLKRFGLLDFAKKTMGQASHSQVKQLSVADFERLGAEIQTGAPKEALVPYARLITTLKSKAEAEHQ